MQIKNGRGFNIAVVSLMTALIAVSSWIAVPFGVIPVTMQTFAVYVATGISGTAKGTLSVAVYLLLGAVGIPVFSGFRGGIGVLLGSTGGYIMGFLLITVVAGLIINRFGRKIHIMCIAFLLGTVACYIFGSAWFLFVYMKGTDNTGLINILISCVFPFIVPDVLKAVSAAFVTKAVIERSRI